MKWDCGNDDDSWEGKVMEEHSYDLFQGTNLSCAWGQSGKLQPTVILKRWNGQPGI